MIDCDLCLEKITYKKKAILKGFEATDDVSLFIRVLDRAIEHAQYGLYCADRESVYSHHAVPDQYRFMIEGSSVDYSGIITIPGVFRLFDRISEDLRVIAESLLMGMSVLFPERSFEAMEVRNRILHFNEILRDPDCITNQPGLPFLRIHGTDNTDTLYGIIHLARCTLKEMIHHLTPHEEYGAYCYNLESSDRFMIRAFMQGVNRMRGSDFFDYPITLGIKDRDTLIIGLFMDEYHERYSLIKIKGLSLTIQLFERYPNPMNSFSCHMAPLQILWRRSYPVYESFDDTMADTLPVESGSFHARSLTDAMQFLSDAGYYISRYSPEYHSRGKIAG